MSLSTPRGKFTRDLHSLPSVPSYELSRRVFVKYVVPGSRVNFDTTDTRYSPQRLSFDSARSRGVLCQSRNERVSSLRVFRDSTILPYLLIGARHYSAELDFLAPQLSGSVPRVPAIYRISDTWVIDDLGRLYREGPRGYSWFQYRLSGDLRNSVTLTNSDGTRLSRAVYTFSALAGYVPSVQYHFAFSLRYDFHHVSENRLDLRPDSVVPLETNLHRYVHSVDLSDEVGRFFKKSKGW